ncbi:MAG: MGMT family protein [Armatimonadetes bacterium]|nr:MGMT family protein [Armatimonadota bacterium]
MASYQCIRIGDEVVAFVWSERGVQRVCLPQPSREAALAAVGVRADTGESCHSELAGLLERFYQGQPVDFGAIALDLGRQTSFTAAVRARVLALGWGQTATYGDVATAAGSPRGARAVGQVMARNPVPPLIPCHRVLGSQGLGGYGGGLALKSRLLEWERG